VIPALIEAPHQTGALADRLGLDSERLEVLLGALASLGYVRRRRNRQWTATRRSRRWLAEEGGVGAMVGELAYEVWESMGSLERVLEGGPPTGWHEREPGDPLWGSYQRAMEQMERLVAGPIADAIEVEAPRRLLDLGGGPGLHAAEMCARHPALEATVVDLEGATRHAPSLERVTFRTGDLFELDLGTGFDVVTAHSLLHNFAPDRCRVILELARAALAPGGLLAVQELERPAGGRGGSLVSSLGGLVFLSAMGSRTYSADELMAMVSDADFGEPEIKRPVRLAGSLVLTARRLCA